ARSASTPRGHENSAARMRDEPHYPSSFGRGITPNDPIVAGAGASAMIRVVVRNPCGVGTFRWLGKDGGNFRRSTAGGGGSFTIRM
ncbi:MAG: hypothetical protein ACRD1G_17865, partial [Acidimicrobiales bacterium]